jgi:hypothetical protein
VDNLNTHTGSSLYEAFPPAEARRLLDRLEFHYTPKHASWLNMAEIEIGVLNRQCLNRRIDNEQVMGQEVAQGCSMLLDGFYVAEDPVEVEGIVVECFRDVGHAA